MTVSLLMMYDSHCVPVICAGIYAVLWEIYAGISVDVWKGWVERVVISVETLAVAAVISVAIFVVSLMM